MNKHTILIPHGYHYIGNATEGQTFRFEIKPGIYCKPTGIGFTTVAITDPSQNTIILMPRISLIRNKHLQHADVTQMVYGDISDGEIMEYISTHKRQKFLCTYDSCHRLKRLLADDFLDYQIVVDEFHLILSDCSFKVYTEMQMLHELEGHTKVTYVSATPHLDYFLENMPEFCDLPYYDIHWEDARPVTIQRLQCNSPIDAAVRIVREYQQGIFPFVQIDDNQVFASEALIFLNSVTNIVNIVRLTGLSPQDVNIITADTSDNRKLISELGEGFCLGHVPLPNESNKLITLCTSTCYFGVDFYSPCAQVYVISDCHRQSTAVSISTELPQIVGRIRNEDNPFRHQIFFIYNTWDGEKDIDSLLADLQQKHEHSIKETDYFNQAPADIRQHLIKMIKREKTICQDRDSFCYYDEDNDRFRINPMSVLSEEYELRVQYSTYHDSMYVFEALSSRHELSASDSITLLTVTEHVRNTLTKTRFEEIMALYCEYRQKPQMTIFLLGQDLERQYPRLKVYYDQLGPQRIHALGCKESRIKQEIKAHDNDLKLRLRFRQLFPVGTNLTASQYKMRMNSVYAEFGINRKGKVSDLSALYGLHVEQHNLVSGNGTRVRHYEITKSPS